jgi:ATP-dependent RNA helicase DHX33
MPTTAFLTICRTVVAALKTLYLLGALDSKKSLTALGRDMAAFPLEPYYARAIIASKEYGCSSEVLEIISVLSASSKLFFDTTDQRESAVEARRKFHHPSGDHWTILNAVKSYKDIAAAESRAGRKEWCRKHFLNERTLVEAIKIRDQLRTTCSRLHIDWNTSCGDNEEPVLRSLSHGLLQNTALLQPDRTYKQIMGQTVGLVFAACGSTCLNALADRKNSSKLNYVQHASPPDCLR